MYSINTEPKYAKDRDDQTSSKHFRKQLLNLLTSHFNLK